MGGNSSKVMPTKYLNNQMLNNNQTVVEGKTDIKTIHDDLSALTQKTNCEKLDDMCSTTCCVQLIMKSAFWIVMSFSFAVYVQERSLEYEKQLPEIRHYSKWDALVIFSYACVRSLVYCWIGCSIQHTGCCILKKCCCCCTRCTNDCSSSKDECARVACCLWMPNYPKLESLALSTFSFSMSLFVFVKKSYEFPTDYEGLLRKDRQMYLLMTRILFLLFVMLTSCCWTPKKKKSPPTSPVETNTVSEAQPDSGNPVTKSTNSETFGTLV